MPFEVAYFKNSFRNLIQWYSFSYGFVEPANVAEAYVKGTELVWNTRLFGGFACTGNWAWQRSEVTRTAKVYHRGKKLPNRPGNFGTCTVEYGAKGFTVFWTVDHKEPYYLDRANQDHRRYPGRTLHDAGCSGYVLNDVLGWKIQAKNITDRHTFDVLGLPKPGRSYMVTFEYHLR